MNTAMNIAANADVIRANIQQIHAQIRAACPPQTTSEGAAAITIIAASKTFPPAAVRAAHAAGISDIGENYLQEAEEKKHACRDLPLAWHFIGGIQTNKTARVAQLFDWVHGVDRPSVARRLSSARAAVGLPPLNVFIQINLCGEAGKSGAAAADAAALAAETAALPALALRGLMVLPPPQHDAARQYEVFCKAAALQAAVSQNSGLTLDCLSMGMSGDYPQAIRAGATHIRLGSAIFGPRPRKIHPRKISNPQDTGTTQGAEK